jgi:hypothetical protein
MLAKFSDRAATNSSSPANEDTGSLMISSSLRKSIVEMLQGRDRRSIGLSDAVVKRVLKNPELISELFEALTHQDRAIRMRAADALEKATRKHPDWLHPFKCVLLERIAGSQEMELRWHVAQLLPRLKLSRSEQEQAVEILTEYLQDASSIVKTFSMQALADLAVHDEQLQQEVRSLLERLTRTGTPAMKARGRKLLKQLRSDKKVHAYPANALPGKRSCSRRDLQH